MNKFKAFFKKLKALANKAGTAIAKVAKKAVKVVVANQAKSIVIGSVAVLAIGGGVATIMLVGNNGHKHNPMAAVTENYVAPTCTVSGSYDDVVYCADCGEEISRVAKTIANLTTHTPTDWITDKASTCKEAGEKHKECTVCKQVIETGIIDPIDHTEVIDSAVAPDCTNTGLSEGKHCFVCNDVLVPQTPVSASGHTSGNTVVENNVDPDCENGGSYDNVVYCSECDTELSRETITVDKLGHSYSSTFVPPTATEDGYTEHHCPACEDTYKDSYVTPIAFEITSSNRSKIGYTGAENENLVIPAVFEDNGAWYRVTRIGDSAFLDCTSLTSVVIPDSVTSIGDYAFGRCYSLTNVVIGDSVTSIGDRAFYYCYSLTSVVIPDSVTTIGNSAFTNCSKLTSVVIGNSVTTIGDHAFGQCYSLTSVVIGNSVTSIGGYAFAYCSKLTSVVIGNSVTSIGRYAFTCCYKLTSVVIGNSVTTIGDHAFVECSKLTSVVIPNSVTSIGDFAFSDCYNLTSAVIGNSVTTIGIYAFGDCNSLTSVVIPDSVTNIGDAAFYNCASLTDIYYTGTEAEWEAINIGSFNDNLTSATIHYNYVPEE